MKPTDVLMQEHRVIERVLDCLEEMASRCESGKGLDVGDAGDTIDFFRNYADACHHGKEEDQLFPLMEQRGFPGNAGPIAVMRAEHEQGRSFIGAMERAIEGASEGDAHLKSEFVRNARGYVDMLRAHIQKEDHCLFPMADGALGADDQTKLEQSFQEVADRFGSAKHDRYVTMADRLADRLGVTRSTTSES